MKKNIFTIIFFMAGSAAICWLCDWRTKVIAWMIIFWVVVAVGVAGATLSEQIRAKKNNRRKRKNENYNHKRVYAGDCQTL